MWRKHQTQRQHRLRMGRLATGPYRILLRDPLGGSVMPEFTLLAHEQTMRLISGRCASISEIAAAEKIDRSYVGSILRLTLLAPDIVQAILDEPQPDILG